MQRIGLFDHFRRWEDCANEVKIANNSLVGENFDGRRDQILTPIPWYSILLSQLPLINNMSGFPSFDFSSLLYVPQPAVSTTPIEYFANVLEQRDRMCQSVLNATKQVYTEAQAIGRNPAASQLYLQASDVSPLPLTRQALLAHMNPATSVFNYEVRLLSSFRFRLIKRRQFAYVLPSLNVKLTPLTDHPDPVAEGTQLALKLFYASSPAVELVTTRRGARLLWGDTTVEMEEEMTATFKSLCFTDVTSCFPLGRLYLVIHCPQRSDIKPLIVEGVRVKSRKKVLT